MRINKWILVSIFLIFLLLSFLGIFFIGNIVHEYSHYTDLKTSTNDSSICLFIVKENYSIKDFFSLPVASYNAHITDQESFDKAEKNTETKAYTKTLLIAGIFLVLVFIFTFAFFKTIKERNDYEYVADYLVTKKLGDKVKKEVLKC